MTEASIRSKVMTNQKWLERAILAIDARQTDDEQRSETTRYLNARGWSAADAKQGSYLARWIRRSDRPDGEKLSGKWVANAKGIISKYCGQLSRIAAEKVAA